MALLVLVDRAVSISSILSKVTANTDTLLFLPHHSCVNRLNGKNNNNLSQTAVLPYTCKTTEVEMNVHTVQKQYKGWYCMHCTHQLQAALWCFDFKLI